MAENKNIIKEEKGYSLIYKATTEGNDCNKTIIPASLLKKGRQYILRIKTNLEDKAYKVIPFRTAGDSSIEGGGAGTGGNTGTGDDWDLLPALPVEDPNDPIVEPILPPSEKCRLLISELTKEIQNQRTILEIYKKKRNNEELTIPASSQIAVLQNNLKLYKWIENLVTQNTEALRSLPNFVGFYDTEEFLPEPSTRRLDDIAYIKNLNTSFNSIVFVCDMYGRTATFSKEVIKDLNKQITDWINSCLSKVTVDWLKAQSPNTEAEYKLHKDAWAPIAMLIPPLADANTDVENTWGSEWELVKTVDDTNKNFSISTYTKPNTLIPHTFKQVYSTGLTTENNYCRGSAEVTKLEMLLKKDGSVAVGVIKSVTIKYDPKVTINNKDYIYTKTFTSKIYNNKLWDGGYKYIYPKMLIPSCASRIMEDANITDFGYFYQVDVAIYTSFALDRPDLDPLKRNIPRIDMANEDMTKYITNSNLFNDSFTDLKTIKLKDDNKIYYVKNHLDVISTNYKNSREFQELFINDTAPFRNYFYNTNRYEPVNEVVEVLDIENNVTRPLTEPLYMEGGKISFIQNNRNTLLAMQSQLAAAEAVKLVELGKLDEEITKYETSIERLTEILNEVIRKCEEDRDIGVVPERPAPITPPDLTQPDPEPITPPKDDWKDPDPVTDEETLAFLPRWYREKYDFATWSADPTTPRDDFGCIDNDIMNASVVGSWTSQFAVDTKLLLAPLISANGSSPYYLGEGQVARTLEEFINSYKYNNADLYADQLMTVQHYDAIMDILYAMIEEGDAATTSTSDDTFTYVYRDGYSSQNMGTGFIGVFDKTNPNVKNITHVGGMQAWGLFGGSSGICNVIMCYAVQIYRIWVAWACIKYLMKYEDCVFNRFVLRRDDTGYYRTKEEMLAVWEEVKQKWLALFDIRNNPYQIPSDSGTQWQYAARVRTPVEFCLEVRGLLAKGNYLGLDVINSGFRDFTTWYEIPELGEEEGQTSVSTIVINRGKRKSRYSWNGMMMALFFGGAGIGIPLMFLLPGGILLALLLGLLNKHEDDSGVITYTAVDPSSTAKDGVSNNNGIGIMYSDMIYGDGSRENPYRTGEEKNVLG